MPWSEGISEQFELVDLFTTEESDYYGPFNTLLVDLFPASDHYQVSPQFKRIEGSLDVTVQFIIRRRRVPVFVEIKTFQSLKELSSREQADVQMRQRFREFSSSSIPIPTLHGISAFGPQFCIYTYNPTSRAINPVAIARDLEIVNDTAPKERWAYNILEEAGEARLRELVKTIREMATA